MTAETDSAQPDNYLNALYVCLPANWMFSGPRKHKVNNTYTLIMNSKIAVFLSFVTITPWLRRAETTRRKSATSCTTTCTCKHSRVSTESVRGLDAYPGTIVPLVEVELRAEVNGYITNIFVKDGQPVKKGQALYEVDRSRYQATYRQLEAQVQIAKANLARVSKDVERYTRLSEQDAIAKQRVDYALADQQTAASQVAAAEANLANAATDLARSVIKAL